MAGLASKRYCRKCGEKRLKWRRSIPAGKLTFSLTQFAGPIFLVPERKGESRSATIAVFPSLKSAFMDGLQKDLRRRSPASGSAGKVLLIRVHLTKADPGTRFPQFGDFQANAAKLAVSGEVIDPATNLILIEFKQERWSGVISIGKTSAQLLQEAARLIGSDVAHMISEF